MHRSNIVEFYNNKKFILCYIYWTKRRYFGRACDEFAERVWPIKISDGARVTLFNKGLLSCDINQSEWEYVSFMMISCIFCYRRYCMMWRHLAPPPLWISWDIVRLLTIEKTRKHDTISIVKWYFLAQLKYTYYICRLMLYIYFRLYNTKLMGITCFYI